MSIETGIYRHFKGNNYQVLGIVRHSETDERLVLYRPLYGEATDELWVRPLQMFLESVQVEGREIPRFTLIRSTAD